MHVYSTAEVLRHVAERHRRIDILVNNAGHPFDGRMCNKRFHEVEEEDFQRAIHVDHKATFNFSQVAFPL